MADLPTIPDEYRDDIEAVLTYLRNVGAMQRQAEHIKDGLPPKRSTFNDDEALAFFRALHPTHPGDDQYLTVLGHGCLKRLAAAGWTAPPALCPPIPVDEVKRRVLARDDHTKAGGAYAVLDVLRDLNRERGHL